MNIVGCDDLGALFLTIVTCVTVGATSVRPQRDRSLRKERPQRDRSLRKERPHTHLTTTREHTVLPYGINVADEFTNGAPRSYPRAPSLAAMPQFTLPHPTVMFVQLFVGMNMIYRCKRKRAHNVRPAENHPFTVILHFPFSILHYFHFHSRTSGISSPYSVIYC